MDLGKENISQGQGGSSPYSGEGAKGTSADTYGTSAEGMTNPKAESTSNEKGIGAGTTAGIAGAGAAGAAGAGALGASAMGSKDDKGASKEGATGDTTGKSLK